jgi:hypothetical protein
MPNVGRNPHPMTTTISRFELIAAELRALGVTIAARPGEYVVNFRDGKDGTARYTDDLDEALELGRTLTAAVPAADRAHTSTSRRRRRPLKMTPKAVRRRFIKRHNRRRRGRTIKRRDDA